MAALKIPKTFTLFGREYVVKVIPAKEWDEPDAVAKYLPADGLILIKRTSGDLMVHSFLHEMMHAIYDALDESELYANEKLIDTTAGLIHQALKSAR